MQWPGAATGAKGVAEAGRVAVTRPGSVTEDRITHGPNYRDKNLARAEFTKLLFFAAY